MLNPRKESKSHIKKDKHSNQESKFFEVIENAKLFREYLLQESEDQMLKRIEDLENELLVVKINKIGGLNQEIFELKTKNYHFIRSVNFLAVSIFCLSLPIIFDISVKIVKFLA